MDNIPNRQSHVAWCYRLLLDREPESDDVINHFVSYRSVHELVDTFLGSTEFKTVHSLFAGHLVDKWAMIECSLGFNLWVNLADAAVSWPIIDEHFESSEIAFVQKYVSAGMRTLDIGTNIGFYSMLLPRLVGAKGSVTGFEPMPSIHQYAVRSAKVNNFHQCLTHNVALSDKEGFALLMNNPASPNKAGAYIADKNEHGLVGIAVPTRLLPSFCTGSVDFIKIDVEGSEYLVLKPFLDSLRKYRPIIMSEVSPYHLMRGSNVLVRDYVSMITDVGYDCVDINTGKRFADDLAEMRFTNVGFIPR